MNSITSGGRINKITTFISLGIFVLALTQKCYCTTASCGDAIMAFLSGTIGFVFGGAALTWLANPLLITSWFITNKKPKLSLILSFAAVLFCVSFLLFKKVISDEAGNYSEIISYGLGYWLWVLSSAVMFIGHVLSLFLNRVTT